MTRKIKFVYNDDRCCLKLKKKQLKKQNVFLNNILQQIVFHSFDAARFIESLNHFYSCDKFNCICDIHY